MEKGLSQQLIFEHSKTGQSTRWHLGSGHILLKALVHPTAGPLQITICPRSNAPAAHTGPRPPRNTTQRTPTEAPDEEERRADVIQPRSKPVAATAERRAEILANPAGISLHRHMPSMEGDYRDGTWYVADSLARSSSIFQHRVHRPEIFEGVDCRPHDGSVDLRPKRTRHACQTHASSLLPRRRGPSLSPCAAD